MSTAGSGTKKTKGIGWLLAAFGVLIKSSKILKALKLLKFGKFLVTFLSMAVSAFVYAFWLGPWFAVGFILLLFIHEMGHVLAMKAKGMPTSAPVFIPMLGAVIFSPGFKNQEEESFVGYGGPFIGGLAAAALFAVWCLLPDRPEIVLMLSFTGIVLNLFNLIPISPLDGGRVTQVIGPWFRYIGFLALLAFTLAVRQPSMLLIWIVILTEAKLKAIIRLSVGAFCLVSMIVLMAAGFSDQKLYMDIIDSVLAGLIVFTFFMRWRTEKRRGAPLEEEKAPPSAPLGIRLKWLALYLLLIAFFVLMLAAEAPYLPHGIKQ